VIKVHDIRHTSVVTLHSSHMLHVAEDSITRGRLRPLPVVEGERRIEVLTS
jgi:hypothetical protein